MNSIASFNASCEATPVESVDSKFVYIWSGENTGGHIKYDAPLKSYRAEYEEFCKSTGQTAYNALWRLFVTVRDTEGLRTALQEKLNYLILHDKPFGWSEVDSKHIQQFLDSRVYKLLKFPRILQIPEKSEEALRTMCEKNPKTLQTLARWVAEKFTASGTFSLYDRSINPAVGRYISFEEMKNHFPNIFPRLAHVYFNGIYGPVSPDAVQYEKGARTNDIQQFILSFSESVALEDLADLIDLVDTPGTNTNVANLLRAHFRENLMDCYEGLSFTDRVCNVDRSIKRAWHTYEIERDWAIEHAAEGPTVSQLLETGFIQWPERPFGIQRILDLLNPRKPFRDPRKSLTGGRFAGGVPPVEDWPSPER